MLFDGKTFAAKRRAALLEKRHSVGALSLGIVAASGDPVTDSYVRIKEKNAHLLGVTLQRYVLAPDADTESAVRLVQEAAACDGVIVQLPLPPHIEVAAVLRAVPPEKDVDALSPAPQVLPPVVAAIREIIAAYQIPYRGKKVVVIGKGRLVGAPAAAYFAAAGATVVVLTEGDDVATQTADADIIVLGAGAPGILTADMVRDGVVVFDAGTSEDGGVVVGDADPAVAEKAALFTPVPGGIGPVAVVEIFGNLLELHA